MFMLETSGGSNQTLWQANFGPRAPFKTVLGEI